MSSKIHPSAVVAPTARIGEDVTIGPFSVIGPNVEIGAGAIIYPHTTIDGHTRLGPNVQVFPGASIGLAPQDLKYDGSPTRLEIGARTVLRECVTAQPGTKGTGLGVTTIGSDCLIMAYSHVAHDCTIGNSVIVANATQMGGHVTVEDNVVLGGATTIHQFTRVGTRAITGAAARVQQDVPPYMLADGQPARLYGLNRVGLRRAELSTETVSALKRAYSHIFIRGPWAEALKEEAASEHEEVRRLCRFISESKRGVMRAFSKRAARSGG